MVTTWIDGMGRRTIKHPTGSAARYEAVFRGNQPFGVCRAPGWVVVQGPFRITANGWTPADQARQREYVMEQARRKRLPGAIRNRKRHLLEIAGDWDVY